MRSGRRALAAPAALAALAVLAVLAAVAVLVADERRAAGLTISGG